MKLRYLLYAVLLLLPFVFRDYTPDNELRYVRIIDEALENHSFFAFYNHGEAYADKPPLFFWLMMLARSLAGEHIFWIYGLFSVLPAIGIVALMDRWMQEERPGGKSYPAGELLLTTGIFLGAALVMRMDMLMAFFIVLSLYTFFRIYRRKNRPYEKWMLPVYLFLGLFTKGPMGLLIPLVSALTYVAAEKGWKRIGACFGWKQLLLLPALCAVWFSCVYVEGGQDYLHNILFRQTIGRGVNSFYHKGPPYYYLKTMVYTFAPWTLAYLTLFWSGFRQKRIVSDVENFFISIIVSSFVLLSLISSKLDVYLLPVYPFIAYLAILQIDKITRWNGWMKAVMALPFLVFALLFPFSSLIFKYLPFPVKSPGFFYAALFVLMLCALLSVYRVYKENFRKALMTCSVGLLLFIGIGSFGLPQLNPHIGVKAMALASCDAAKENGIDRYAYYKFRAGENLDVYMGVEPEKLEDISGLDRMLKKGAYILMVRDRERRREPELEQWLTSYNPLKRIGDYEIFVIMPDIAY